MEQTADWLKKLGMSEYAQRFAETGLISALSATRPINISKTSVSRSGTG
jgi:hypothetical protein